MSDRIAITQNELLEAVAASITTGPEDARTIQEIMQETGLSRERVRQALMQYNREGRLQSHPVVRRAIDGHFRKVPGYIVTSPVSDQRMKQHRRPSKRR